MTNADYQVPDEFPIDMPEFGRPYREVVITDTVRTGQPRPYADHERVIRVTIREYDYHGELSERSDDADAAADEDAHLIAQAIRHECSAEPLVSAELGEQLVTNRWWHSEFKIRKLSSYAEAFNSFVQSAKVVAPYTVEITTITPFTD